MVKITHRHVLGIFGCAAVVLAGFVLWLIAWSFR
jgi:ADP-ribosylglycohydrolase